MKQALSTPAHPGLADTPPAAEDGSALTADTLPAAKASVAAVPATAVPATAVPATAVPATAAPATAIPAVTVPATAIPAVTVPAAKASKGPLDTRLLRHARSSRAGIAGLAALGAGQAAATLVVAVALAMFVAGNRQLAAVLLGAAFATRAALTWAEHVVAARTAAHVRGELRTRMLRSMLRRGPSWVASFGAGRLTATLTNGLDALGPWFGAYLPSLMLGVTLPPLVILVMAVTDLRSALIATATLPLIPLLGALIGWATQARAEQRWAADARLAGHFLDVVQGLATLRVYGRAERQVTVIADLTDKHRRATLHVLRVAFLSSTALDLVGTLSVGLIAVTTGLRVAAGHLHLAPGLLIILLAPEVYRPLREMAARYHAAADATAVITDVDEILTPTSDHKPRTDAILTTSDRQAPATPTTPDHQAATTPTTADHQAPTTLSTSDRRAVTLAEAALTASGLRVRYPGAAADALALDELAVHAGEIVALAGPSGAGKTTALRVLAGLHTPGAGTSRATPQTHYLPQRVALPHARTVADLFTPQTTKTQITAALRTVALHPALSASSPLGERGTGVSAGQRHRLALAALLHKVSPAVPAVLLLDEPTAHLDDETERLVIARLREAATAGCAILVVAHRPALLAAADRIVTLTAPAGSRPGIADAVPGLNEAYRPYEGVGVSEDFPVPAFQPVTPQDQPRFKRAGFALALGAGSSLAGVVLTGAAAWLLVRAASLPPVLTLSAAVVLVRGSAVARPLLRYLERLLAHDVAFARLGIRRAAVYADLIPRVPGPRLRRRGDLLARVVEDVDARVDGLLRGRLPALSAAVTLLITAATAAWIAPAVALPIGAGLAITCLVAPALAARLAARSEAATADARTVLRDAMVESVDGLEELADGLITVPEQSSFALAHQEAAAAVRTGAATAVAHLGWGVAVAGTALALQHAAGLAHEWTAVVMLGIVALGEAAVSLPDAAVARHRARAADRRLEALKNEPLPVTFPSPVPPADLKQVQPDRTGDVEINGLWAGWGEPVLRGLDLKLAAGERVAILGRSGSGKSTLGAVLGRFLDPVAGVVTMGGRDLRELPEHVVRGRIALVSDETGHVFASTVRENLRLARPGAGDAELAAVLTRVRLDSWLAGLPDGLDTWLGTGGGTMSGGQARRLGVARALLAAPALLILDEPTEGLDEPTAEALMTDLLGAADVRSVLLLTHHTEGLDSVNRVLHLEDLQVAS